MILQENLNTASTHHGRGVANHISAVSEAWLLLLLPQLEQLQSLSSTSQLPLLKSQGQWAALHSPGALASLAALSWEGSSGHGRAFTTPLSQSEYRGTALQNYLITGQESKDSFRTIFLGLVSRTCFWVSSKAPCAHKKPGKHLILQVKRHFQDSKELSFGGNRLLCWQPLKHGCDITETFSPTLKFL